MSDVYANGMEISAKKDSNKSVCAMPDVCLSPPSPPAGPIPIPYPNTATASDTSEGSKTVKVGGQEVGLKNKSNYKKSNGDEAATKSLGMGIVSHNIQGAMKHAAWSMDVKIEGENVIRHMDLTTHNHSNPSQPAVILNRAKEKIQQDKPLSCKELDAVNKDARRKEMRQESKDEPFTMTTASRTTRGRTKFMKAVTPQDTILSEKTSGYQAVNKYKTKACSRKMYGMRHKNHTEPKLIEPEYQRGGSIKMKIFHQFTNKKGNLTNDCMPCGSCRRLLCIAEQCDPKLNITLCNKDNKEVKAEVLCKDGKPKDLKDWKKMRL